MSLIISLSRLHCSHRKEDELRKPTNPETFYITSLMINDQLMEIPFSTSCLIDISLSI